MQRGKVRVAALMLAAAEVFAERGTEAATMTEIATVAHASIGSLYQFFPTKELLAAALHAQLLEELSAGIAGLRASTRGLDAATRADRLFAWLSAFLSAHPEFLALSERRDIDPVRKRATRARLLDEIGGLLAEASPPLPRERAATLAVLVLQLMKAAVRMGGAEDEAMRDAVNDELRQMLAGHLARS